MKELTNKKNYVFFCVGTFTVDNKIKLQKLQYFTVIIRLDENKQVQNPLLKEMWEYTLWRFAHIREILQ